MPNAIMTIHPYRYHDQWVFDDSAVGLDKEPFVAGADEIIDVMVEDLPDAASGFNMLFSAVPFPGHQFAFERRHEEAGGWWYEHEATHRQGWLCPALFKYFDDAPKQLFVQVK